LAIDPGGLYHVARIRPTAQHWIPGGSVKAEGFGDGAAHGKLTIVKLRLTLPPICITMVETATVL
jgi:hypothetical protein